MKFTTKLAVTALALAMSATTAWAVSPVYQTIADQFAKVNQLTLDKNAYVEAKIADDVYDVLRRVIKDDFHSLSYEAKVERINKIRSTYESTTNSSEFAKKVVEVLKDPAKVIEQETAVTRSVRGEKELPNEQNRLQALLTTTPVNESHLHVRATQALDSQLSLDLLSTLNHTQGKNTAFAIVNGIAASGNDLSVVANQVVAGYKMRFAQPQVLDVALLANTVMNNTKRGFGGADFTTSVNNYGAGLYAKVTEQALQFSGLVTFNKGTQNLNANVDFTSLVNGLLDEEFKNEFEGYEKSQTPVTAHTSTANLVLKGEYALNVQPGLVVTPGLAYHYHSFTASNQTITDKSKTYELTPELSVRSPFIPEVSMHGVGATLDVGYKLRNDVTVGADASIMYYSGNSYKSPDMVIEAYEAPVSTTTGATETRYKISATFKDTSTSYLNLNLAAKAQWAIDSNFTLGAKVGYSYVSELPLNGVNYNLNINYKF